jgi:L-amino acid N-acyltransferase YncA
MGYTIEEMKNSDGAQVLEIYRMGIATGQATFETQVPSWSDWDAGHLAACRLVARAGDSLIGWAALSVVSKRKVYAGVAEVSIYVHEDFRGQRVGEGLLNELIKRSEKQGIWMLQSSTFPENTASIALHEKCGFRLVGRREKIARHFGAWRDTVLLERRSRIAGCDSVD